MSELNPKNLEITTIVSTGHPGAPTPQGVKILHKPTGIVATSTGHRHAHGNKTLALEVLQREVFMYHEYGFALQPFRLVGGVHVGYERPEDHDIVKRLNVLRSHLSVAERRSPERVKTVEDAIATIQRLTGKQETEQ